MEELHHYTKGVIEEENSDIPSTYYQFARKLVGSKLVTCKQVIRLDVLGNIKIEPFTAENKAKSKDIEEDDADETIDKLTTSNIRTSKNKEKEANVAQPTKILYQKPGKEL